jgi:hypothetical protein
VEEPSELESFLGPNGREYAALKQRIEKLDAEADRLRHRERADSVSWALQINSEYGISAADWDSEKHESDASACRRPQSCFGLRSCRC